LNTTDLLSRVNESVKAIRAKDSRQPVCALILGSGLGSLANAIDNCTIFSFADIPYFRISTAPGHAGRLIIGELAGKTVLCLQGRLHLYEGYTMAETTYPVRVMAKLGIKTLILTNACGGIDQEMTPGELLLISDHINFMGFNPLIGPNEDDFGIRFPDMSSVYSKKLRELAQDAGKSLGIPLREGVYIGCPGPSFETPAEIRFFRSVGADAVGMSTVPEAIVARHSGLDVLGISCITNLAAGIIDQPLSGEEVNIAAAKAEQSFSALLKEIVQRLDC
jgi:purine-nucleoside phosphorylase